MREKTEKTAIKVILVKTRVFPYNINGWMYSRKGVVEMQQNEKYEELFEGYDRAFAFTKGRPSENL